MIRVTAMSAALLVLASLSVTSARAQDGAVGGAIVGGALGGIIGGAATGRAGGAVAGALIGGATGAIIGAEAERRQGGYYWWHDRCYYRYPSGDYMVVRARYCG